MKSRESSVASQVRLRQWSEEIRDCQNRPEGVTVDAWCKQHGIKKANYYWRLKRVRQACLNQMEQSAGNFVELPVPVQSTMPVLTDKIVSSAVSAPAATLRLSDGITIDISETASGEFIKKLLGTLTNA